MGSKSTSMDFSVVGVLLALALIVGGAGLSFPLLEMFLELAAIAAAVYLLLTPRSWRFDRLSLAALALVAMLLLLPLVQLVPLPPDVWKHLPGRKVPAELDAALGLSLWRPLTLDVEGTVRAFLSLLPAAVLFLGTLFLSVAERARLLWIIFGFAMVNAALGIVQFVTGGGFTPYPSGHLGYAIGFFVNRNHSAALALVAMPVAAALIAPLIGRGNERVPFIVAILSVLVILAIMVLATTSRMGLLVLPFAFATALFLTFYRQPPWRIALPSLLTISAVGLFLSVAGGFDRTLVRYSSLNDPRLSYWNDIQWAFQHYGLAGTGFGTFIPVYQSAESLEAVAPAITNHAHNDFLEIALEGGFPAIALGLFFFGLLGIALVRCARARTKGRVDSAAIAAAAGIAILLLCSLVDYPLRMLALSALLALLSSVLIGAAAPPVPAARELVPRAAPGRKARRAPRRPLFNIPRTAALAGAAFAVPIIVQAAMSSRDLLRGRYDSAVEWASWSTRAHEGRSTAILRDKGLSEAVPDAIAAVRLSPISAAAIRTLGLAGLAAGRDGQGARLMAMAVTLGWRDVLTQLWAIQAAMESGETEKAVQRAEALFRQERSILPAMVMLLRQPGEGQALSMLADRLAQGPAWRKAFFNSARRLPGQDVARFAELVAKLGKSPAPVTAEEARPLLSRLLAAKEEEQARRIWQSVHQHELVENGRFAKLADGRPASLPAAWQVDRRSDAKVRVAEVRDGAEGRALQIRTGNSLAPVVLSQKLMLDAGLYSLRLRARAGTLVGLEWQLRCAESGAREQGEAQIAADGWREARFLVAVPERHCPIQRLAVSVPRGTPRAEIWLDRIELSRMDR